MYTLRKSDPANGLFVVNPNMIDGPVSSSNPALPTDAISANTTLTMIGQGVFDYGQPIMQDFLYLLENFSNDTPPVYPIQGQLWYRNSTTELFVYDGSAWISPAIGGLGIGDLDLHNFRIINLASPVSGNDAVNLTYANTHYVAKTGDTMTGALTLSGNPSSNLHAATKQYVDTTISTSLSGLSSLFVLRAGSTMTGSLTMSGASTHVILPNAPTLGTHAANKAYVDSVVSSGGLFVQKSGDTMTGTLSVTFGNVALSSGDFTSTNGNLILTFGNATVGGNASVAGTLNVTGPTTLGLASSSGLTMQGNIDANGYAISNVPSPSFAGDAANRAYVDAAISTVSSTGGSSTILRSIQIADGVATTYVLPDTYVKATNSLQVYVNGVKHIASVNATAYGTVTPAVTLQSNTGLVPSTSYGINLTVDGGPPTDVFITTGASTPVTFASLISALNAELSSLSLDVRAGLIKSRLTFVASSAGVGSSVTLAAPTSGASLLTAISGLSGPTNEVVSTSYGYIEDGTALSDATSVTFASPPPSGAVIEFVIFS